ncbi:hypothetical protein D3C87_1814940 [compost metagenome]
MRFSCSKFVAQMPMMKPNRLKLTAVSTKNRIIMNGWAMVISTKKEAVIRMIVPIISPLVAAAPT